MSFDEFWKKYPRKIEKPEARREYHKALQRTTHEVIMEGLRRFNTLGPGAGEKQFIIYPARWLKRDRWEDEYEDVPVEKSFGERQEESWMYTYVTTGEWRGPENRKPSIEQARERAIKAGFKIDNVVKFGE